MSMQYPQHINVIGMSQQLPTSLLDACNFILHFGHQTCTNLCFSKVHSTVGYNISQGVAILTANLSTCQIVTHALTICNAVPSKWHHLASTTTIVMYRAHLSENMPKLLLSQEHQLLSLHSTSISASNHRPQALTQLKLCGPSISASDLVQTRLHH